MQVGDNGGSGPNYYPNSRELWPNAPRPDPAQANPEPFPVEGGLAGRYPNKKWVDQVRLVSPLVGRAFCRVF
jgi:catalase